MPNQRKGPKIDPHVSDGQPKTSWFFFLFPGGSGPEPGVLKSERKRPIIKTRGFKICGEKAIKTRGFKIRRKKAIKTWVLKSLGNRPLKPGVLKSEGKRPLNPGVLKSVGKRPLKPGVQFPPCKIGPATSNFHRAKSVLPPVSRRSQDQICSQKKSESYPCVIWRLFKLTWQVNLTSNNLSSELKSGKRARWQVHLSSQLVMLTNLSNGTCHCKWDLSTTKRTCRRQPAKTNLRIASASEKVFARLFILFFACSCLSRSSVFGLTRCEIWPWHKPPPTSFSQYKQVVHRKWA